MVLTSLGLGEEYRKVFITPALVLIQGLGPSPGFPSLVGGGPGEPMGPRALVGSNPTPGANTPPRPQKILALTPVSRPLSDSSSARMEHARDTMNPWPTPSSSTEAQASETPRRT